MHYPIVYGSIAKVEPTLGLWHISIAHSSTSPLNLAGRVQPKKRCNDGQSKDDSTCKQAVALNHELMLS